jgi:hypothetical protein
VNRRIEKGTQDMEQRNEFSDREDLVCSNCQCEIMIKHPGDTAKGYGKHAHTCPSGAAIQPEHQRADQGQTAGVGSR